MIEVKHLVKRYGNHTAVDDISFEAHPGEILGLLGPNGAGKTTTMRILTGFMPPTSGTAVIAGFDVLEDSLDVREHVGYLPERVPVYPDMTVFSYVKFWAKLRGVRRPNRRVDEVLEQFELTDRKKMLVRHLSKGLRQRLGLAQAIVHDPDVVILDEPTIGIDPRQVIEVRDTVRKLRENHTVLFSSHILSEVEQVCDRVVIINKGKLVAQGTTEMLSQQLTPGLHLYVAVQGDPAQIEQTLAAIPNVDRVYIQGEGFIIDSPSDVDIRADVTTAITQAGFTLLEMRPQEVTLEDIFLDIVERS